jgi:hypothetical protein
MCQLLQLAWLAAAARHKPPTGKRYSCSVNIRYLRDHHIQALMAVAAACIASTQVNKVQGEASDIWQKMANAEQGSAVNRLYKCVGSIQLMQRVEFGRILASVAATGVSGVPGIFLHTDQGMCVTS